MWQKIVLKLEQGKKYIVELIDQSTVRISHHFDEGEDYIKSSLYPGVLVEFHKVCLGKTVVYS